MATDQKQAERILQNLKDAGCEPETISLFMQLYRDEKTRDQLCLLAEHRKKLLAEIHSAQEKLDCLDYLIGQIRKTSHRA